MAGSRRRQLARQLPSRMWSPNTSHSRDSMLVLDENLPAAQRLLLLRWRIHFRVVGLDLAAWGTDDENLIPALRRLPQHTFFSLDRDFCRRDRSEERRVGKESRCWGS